MYILKSLVNKTDADDIVLDEEEAERTISESKLIEKREDYYYVCKGDENNNLSGLYKYLQGGSGEDDFYYTLRIIG